MTKFIQVFAHPKLRTGSVVTGFFFKAIQLISGRNRSSTEKSCYDWQQSSLNKTENFMGY